jgi:hypothetical protein
MYLGLDMWEDGFGTRVGLSDRTHAFFAGDHAIVQYARPSHIGTLPRVLFCNAMQTPLLAFLVCVGLAAGGSSYDPSLEHIARTGNLFPR